MTLSTRRVTLWVLLALIAATLGLIFAVSHMSHSVWYDESLTDIIARQPTFGGLVKSAMDLKAYPPAFFVVVRWVYSVDDSPGGMRLPSAVFGFLATLAVFALGSIAGGSAVGALAGAFFVLTPGALRYFSDGNAYTLLMLASAVSTVCRTALYKRTGGCTGSSTVLPPRWVSLHTPSSCSILAGRLSPPFGTASL